MFSRIKVLHNFIVARHESVKILQIESKKISKADRIKKLHFENKYLYGSKIKEKAKKEVTEPVDVENLSNKDISSEIYWTCLHVPEVQDFTKEKKVKKSKKPKKEDSETKVELKVAKEKTKVPKAKKEPKKLTIAPDVLLPDSLANLQNSLSSVKADVKDKSSSISKLRSTESVKNALELEIPFETLQLREILNFPMTITKGNRIVSEFERFVPKETSIFKPSVSKVLQATMPENQRNALMHWKQLKITELGLEGFELMQKSHLSRGKQFHHCLQRHFQGETIVKAEIAPEVVEMWNSIEPLLGNFQAPGVLIEEKLQHPYLHYKGVVDCVSFHNSSLSVIEWKKSDRHKTSLSSTFDAPVQLCSYLGCLNASRPEFLSKPIKNGVIVVAYNDGQKADLFEMGENELKKYWKVWVSRLQEYWIRYKDNTLPPEI